MQIETKIWKILCRYTVHTIAAHDIYCQDYFTAILLFTIFWQWRSTLICQMQCLIARAKGNCAHRHAKTRSVCTRLKAASVCLRHCQKVVNRSIVKNRLVQIKEKTIALDLVMSLKIICFIFFCRFYNMILFLIFCT